MAAIFDESFKALKSKKITGDQYVNRILFSVEFARGLHEWRMPSWDLAIRDPVGSSIIDALTETGAPQKYLTSFETLFRSILNDDNPSKHLLNICCTDGNILGGRFIQAVATFAAFHSCASILRQCLEMGASLSDRNTANAIEYAFRDADLLDVLYEYDWRDIRHSHLAFSRMALWSLHTSPQELSWFLDHGAYFDRESIKSTIQSSPVKAACVETLIQRVGAAVIRNTNLLQNAAKRGCRDVVQVLLRTGMDVDELIPSASLQSSDSELTALYEAVRREHVDVIQLLLEYGANPTKKVGDMDLDTPLKLAQGHNLASIVAMLERRSNPGNMTANVNSSKL